MFLTNNAPDLYALTLCITFRKKAIISGHNLQWYEISGKRTTLPICFSWAT